MTACLKLRIAWLLLLSALAPYGEAAPRLLAAEDTCGMSCCRKAKSCCCRKARPLAGWAAARTCPANCGQPAKLPGMETLARVPAQSSAQPLAPAGHMLPSHDRLAAPRNARITRLQRPPPAC